MRTRPRTAVIGMLTTGALTAAALVVTAPPAAATGTPACSNASFTANGSCRMPGFLGSGAWVSIVSVASGGGGGGGFHSPNAHGGDAAQLFTAFQVPAGSTLTIVIGQGGKHSDQGHREGASGGGSSAILLGSTVIAEAGGGGGATNDSFGGSGAAGATQPAGGDGDTDCSGRGGAGYPSLVAGAAGSVAGACAPTPSAYAGLAGTAGARGTGGRGGTPTTNAAPTVPGGAGYAAGGAGGGGSLDSVVGGGGGGGGGAGGGGGGTAAAGTNGGTGAGGGGGTTVDAHYATFASAQPLLGSGGVAMDGQPGRVAFGPVGPTVATSVARPTSVTTTSAVVHSMVNANGPTTSRITMEFSTSRNLLPATVHLAGVTPTQVGGFRNVAVSSSLRGLAPCTTYYYRLAASTLSPVGAAVTRAWHLPGAAGAVPDGRPSWHLAAIGGSPVSFGTFGAIAHVTTACPLPLSSHVALSTRNALPLVGTTRLISSATTSAAGRVVTSVRCAPAVSTFGDVSNCTARIGSNGSVTVTTFGVPNLLVTVTQRAVPVQPGHGWAASPPITRTWRVG